MGHLKSQLDHTIGFWIIAWNVYDASISRESDATGSGHDTGTKEYEASFKFFYHFAPL